MSREPYWQQPKWIAAALDRGAMTPCEFMLVCYLGGSGLDYRGVAVTLRQLAATLGYSSKWISQSLHALRERGLIEFDLRPGRRRPFAITAGPALLVGAPSLYDDRPDPEGSEPDSPTSEVTSEVTPARDFGGHLGSGSYGDQAQAKVASGVAAGATSEVTSPAENENENRKPLAPIERLPPEVDHRGVGDEKTPAEVLGR